MLIRKFYGPHAINSVIFWDVGDVIHVMRRSRCVSFLSLGSCICTALGVNGRKFNHSRGSLLSVPLPVLLQKKLQRLLYGGQSSLVPIRHSELDT